MNEYWTLVGADRPLIASIITVIHLFMYTTGLEEQTQLAEQRQGTHTFNSIVYEFK